jgi:hypothetical protein
MHHPGGIAPLSTAWVIVATRHPQAPLIMGSRLTTASLLRMHCARGLQLWWWCTRYPLIRTSIAAVFAPEQG